MAIQVGAGLFCGLLMAVLSAESLAQTAYPTRPVRLVVPSSAGGGSDTVARAITPKLSEFLGQQVIVDNRPGAGTTIGGEVVAKSPPDGYTLLLCLATLATNPLIYKKVPYDAQRDFAPITLAAVSPNILVVHPSVPVKTVKELIGLARTHPGQLNFASAGHGTGSHLAMELFLSMAKVNIVHIPYKGAAPAVIGTLAGHVAVMAGSILSSLPHVRNGRLRALGVTTARRSSAAPEIPSIAEAGLPGYASSNWYGVVAPAQTPREIITRLHRELARILHSPDVKERLSGDGADPVGNTPEDFARFIRAETEKWAKIAREAGIKPQ